jgi:Tfp pilus assembly protein PilO
MNFNKKTIVSLSVSIICVVVFAVAGTWPLVASMSKSSDQLIASEQSLSSLARKNENLQDAQKNYSAIEGDLQKISKTFVNIDFPVGLIQFLENTAKSSGVQIKYIQPGAAEDVKGAAWKSAKFQVEVDGAYQKIMVFLEKVEYGPYATEVSDLSARRAFGAGVSDQIINNTSQDSINVSLVIKVFGEK